MRALMMLAAALAVGCGADATDLFPDGVDLRTPAPENAGEEARPLYVERGTGAVTYGDRPVIEFGEVGPAGELGQLEQGLVFAPQVSGSLQPGIIPDTQYSCLHGVPLQNCLVPPNNVFKYFTIGGDVATTALVNSILQSVRLALINQGMLTCSQNWCPKFSQGASINDSTLTVVIDANPSNNAFCSDGSPSEIHGYQCPTGQTTGITPSGLSGTYHRFLKPGEASIPVWHIDAGAINLRNGWDQSQKNRALWHAAASLVLNFFGKGLVNPPDNRCTKAVIETATNCPIRAADACFVNGIGDNANLSSVWQGGADCGS